MLNLKTPVMLPQFKVLLIDKMTDPWKFKNPLTGGILGLHNCQVVRELEEACLKLSEKKWEILLLGVPEGKTGYDVVKWLENHPENMPEHVTVINAVEGYDRKNVLFAGKICKSQRAKELENMKPMRPYLSIDIETTGLNIEKSEILQIAAVLDDGVSNLDGLEYFCHVVELKSISYGEPYALKMNAWLMELLTQKECESRMSKMGIQNNLLSLLNKGIKLALEWDQKNDKKPTKRISVAGKNVAGFDLPIIRNQLFKGEEQKLDSLVLHRTIDVGSLFFSDFGYVPTLDEVMKYIDRPLVAHDAYADCISVISAIRRKMLIF